MLSKETLDMVTGFRDDRNWRQFHNPKDLAISLSLEASELLEVFQWSGTDLECSEKKAKIEEELADVLCYSILMADVCGLDLDEIVQKRSAATQKNIPWTRPSGKRINIPNYDRKPPRISPGRSFFEEFTYCKRRRFLRCSSSAWPGRGRRRRGTRSRWPG